MKRALLLIIFILVSKMMLSQVFISDNTKIVLDNEVHLSVAGNLRNEGSIFGSGFLKLTEGKLQSISGNGLLENFSIKKTTNQVEISEGNQDVFRSFEIHGGTFIPNARLTLKSVDTLTAQIGQNTGGVINGDFTIERFIPKSNRAFRYFSSPVSTSESILSNLQEGQNNTGINYPSDNIDNIPGFGTHITGSKTGDNGFDATFTANQSFYNWNANSQSWSTIPNTNLKTLEKGESFSLLVRGSRATYLGSNTAIGPETTLRLTGNPTILNFTKNVNLTTDNSFLLLGNPYHAAIDANLFFQNNTNLNSNFIYVFDPTLNTRGGYATVDLPSGTNLQGSVANQFIQPWQSFFVEASNVGSTTLSLSFSETDKDVSQPQVETFSLGTRINLKLQHENETIDGVSLKLEHGANSEIDKRDAWKFLNKDENLSIYSKGNDLSVEERDFPKTKETVMIHLDQKRNDNYTLLIDGTNLSQTNAVFKDFYLDKSYALEDNQELLVDYQVADDEPDLRFGFIIGSETLSTDEFTSKEFRIYPNPANDVLNIEALNLSGQKLKFDIYSLLGQKVAEGDFKNQNIISNYDISTFSADVYLVVITDNNDLKETLKFIKL